MSGRSVPSTFEPTRMQLVVHERIRLHASARRGVIDPMQMIRKRPSLAPATDQLAMSAFGQKRTLTNVSAARLEQGDCGCGIGGVAE
jgi:hypothetical protein